MAPDAEAQFREKFGLDELTVFEDDHWTLSVRPVQPVLGALVLSTRHGALDFSSVPPAAGTTMFQIIGRAETAARQIFGAVRVNALCLMMQDPLFHFHLLPRYDTPAELTGRAWPDSGWPGLPDLAASQATGDDELLEIRSIYAALDWA